jgi:hypothetical protein
MCSEAKVGGRGDCHRWTKEDVMARKVAKKSKSSKAKKATRKVKSASPRGMARVQKAPWNEGA